MSNLKRLARLALNPTSATSFLTPCDDKSCNWIDDPKVQDRFVLFNTFDKHPVVTKRRSNGSSEQKEKRSRQASQSNAGGTIASHGASLHSIGE